MIEPAYYEFRVKSHLGPSSAHAFAGFSIRHEASGETILVSPLIDQAALHGALMKIRDLGLVLVELKCLPYHPETQ